MASFNLLQISPTRSIGGCGRRRTLAIAILNDKAHPPINGSKNFSLTDTVVDATGTPVVNATVKLFRTGDDSFVASTTTDGSGFYTFNQSNNAGLFYVIAYKSGSPDTFGTSKNNLTMV